MPELEELPGVLDAPPAAPGVPEESAPLEPEVPELPGVLDELAPPVAPDVPELPGALEELPGVLEEEPAPPAALPDEEVSPLGGVLPVAPVLGVLEVEPEPVVPAAPEELEELGALLGVLELEELGVLPPAAPLVLLSSDFFPQPANSSARALAARTSLDAFIVDFIMTFLSIKLIGC